MAPIELKNLNEACEHIFKAIEGPLRVGAPLGLGKPNQLLNLIYDRVVDDPKRPLEIYTALTLSPPRAKSELEGRFLEPFKDRHFGKGYPELRYAQDLRTQKLPAHIKVHEFYMQAGQYAHNTQAQSNYTSLNYTHVARNLVERGINLLVQMVAKDPNGQDSRLSLSCNPDLTLDVIDICKEKGQKIFSVAVVHPDLPFVGGDALVDRDYFDVVVESPEVKHQLFALPKNSVDPIEHAIGLYASQLIEDGGTLQIGIGSLSDAVVHSTLLRQKKNDRYVELTSRLWHDRVPSAPQTLKNDLFKEGLYGTSEMLMDGFMHLREGGVLKRLIFDQDEQQRRYLHGAFFLGSKSFYAWLRGLKGADFDGLSMTRVSKVNDLYDPHELALRRQRRRARFFNTCMNVTLLGGAASDTLENGEVVSGVGGQYNFVAMSQELPDSHSILMLRSSRKKDGKRVSNIVTGHPHLTIPRHLRDIVITEYGIAWLKGKSDEEVVKELIGISDAEFQEELVAWAKKNHKLDKTYQIPFSARRNTPENLKKFMDLVVEDFPEYPFGSDFTDVELKLLKGLGKLREAGPLKLLKTAIRGFNVSPKDFKPELERLNLQQPKSFKQRVYRRVVLGSLV